LQQNKRSQQLDADHSASHDPCRTGDDGRPGFLDCLEDGFLLLFGIDERVGVIKLFEGMSIRKAHDWHPMVFGELLGLQVEIQLFRKMLLIAFS